MLLPVYQLLHRYQIRIQLGQRIQNPDPCFKITVHVQAPCSSGTNLFARFQISKTIGTDPDSLTFGPLVYPTISLAMNCRLLVQTGGS